MPRRKIFWIVPLVVVVVVIAMLRGSRQPALPPIMIVTPGSLPPDPGAIPYRWIPYKWVWLHRACRSVLGAPRQVRFNITVIGASNTVAQLISEAHVSPPDAESNGVAAWLIPDGTTPQIFGPATTIHAGLQTADHVAGAIFMTGGAAQTYKLGFSPRLRDHEVDASMNFEITSGSVTDFVASVRAQLPYGRSLFLLDDRNPEVSTNRIELLIVPLEIDAHGNQVGLNGSAPPRP